MYPHKLYFYELCLCTKLTYLVIFTTVSEVDIRVFIIDFLSQFIAVHERLVWFLKTILSQTSNTAVE